MRHGNKRHKKATPGGAAMAPEERRIAICVDDEESDLEALRDALASAGYQVKTALDGKTALQIFKAHEADVEILVTDIAMAPMSGTELADEMVRLKPDLRVVFVSGYSGSQAFRYRGVPIADFAFVSKPFTAEALLSKIRPGIEKALVAGGGGGMSDV
jgi:two-component system cell cycle sensor histidine kinase/response regulator CckA